MIQVKENFLIAMNGSDNINRGCEIIAFLDLYILFELLNKFRFNKRLTII